MAWTDPHPVPPDAAGERLVDYLKAHLIVVPVNEIGDAVTGTTSCLPDITIEGRAETRTDSRLAAGDRLIVSASLETRLTAENRLTPAVEIALEVVHEDADLLVLNKPAGTHVHPVGKYRDATLLNGLVWRAGARPGNPWGAWRPHPAHRLDRPVSGLVLIAKSNAVSGALNDLQQRDLLKRRYLAWVDGVCALDRGTIAQPLGKDPAFEYRRAVLPVADGGQLAVTHWTVRERRIDRASEASEESERDGRRNADRARTNRTLVELDLDTGRTHQIRVHLASIGHPVCGDLLYARTPVPGQKGAFSATRIALHSWQVAFEYAGRPLALTAAPPPGFDAIAREPSSRR